MTFSVNGVSSFDEVEQTKKEPSKQVRFRAKSKNKLERNPEEDTFEKKGNKKKVGKIIGWSAAAVLAILAAIFYKKGKAAEKVINKAGSYNR